MNQASNKLVTIIMPVYNSERFVGEAIESVMAQSYTDWELLVIDDASNDKSVDIVREYERKDSRIHLLFNKNNIKMPSAPRNEGIKHAKGRYIAFLDSDDLWLPNKLEQQVPLFGNDDVAIVYSNYDKVDINGKKNGHSVIAPSKASYRKLLQSNFIGNLTGIYDSSKVGKIEIMNIHHEDYAMWLSILKKGFIAKNTNTITASYRVYNGSITSNKMGLLSWQWFIYRKIEKLSLPYSVYNYIHYAIRAFIKNAI